jgi:hypothetical protein
LSKLNLSNNLITIGGITYLEDWFHSNYEKEINFTQNIISKDLDENYDLMNLANEQSLFILNYVYPQLLNYESDKDSDFVLSQDDDEDDELDDYDDDEYVD